MSGQYLGDLTKALSGGTYGNVPIAHGIEASVVPNLFMDIPEYFFNDKIRKAREFAEICHTGQMYGNDPYVKHLSDCYKIFLEFVIEPVYGRSSQPSKSGVIDKYQDISCAIWLHDTIEDTGTSYDEIEEHFGTDVASLVLAVSGEGSNRKERLQSIGRKMEDRPDAVIIKLCDRIANTRSSSHEYYSTESAVIIEQRDSLFSMYVKEFPAFKETLGSIYPEVVFVRQMWKYLEGITGF